VIKNPNKAFKGLVREKEVIINYLLLKTPAKAF